VTAKATEAVRHKFNFGNGSGADARASPDLGRCRPETGLVARRLASATVAPVAILAHGATAIGQWRRPLAFAAAGLAVVLLGYDGYSKPVGFHAFMASVASPQAEPLIHGVAAVAIVVLVLCCDPIRGRPVGRTSGLLGRLSFPVYLVHLPVLHGLVAPVHSKMVACCDSTVADLTAFALFIALTLIAAYPLARLDEAWVRRLRATAGWPAARQPRVA
jgi:peptidoglycan/LPS O-acetylase OafA/YrhL